MVATGGSGHGFKYLPVLGKWIVDIVEGKESAGSDAEIKRRWRWRGLSEGEKPYNVIMEGSKGECTLEKQVLVSDESLMEEAAPLSSRL